MGRCKEGGGVGEEGEGRGGRGGDEGDGGGTGGWGRGGGGGEGVWVTNQWNQPACRGFKGLGFKGQRNKVFCFKPATNKKQA